MSNANVLLFTGEIAEPPEIHTSAAGTSVIRFVLAVVERRRRGRRVVEQEELIPCAALGDRAEYLIRREVGEGTRMFIQGRWETRDRGPQCVADHVEILGGE